MKEFKVKVDRKKLSKEHIESKQNFDSVLAQVKTLKTPFWKSAWFYGSAGLTGIALVVGYSFSQNKKQFNETINTQITEVSPSSEGNDMVDEPVLIAQVANVQEAVPQAIRKNAEGHKSEKIAENVTVSKSTEQQITVTPDEKQEQKSLKKQAVVSSVMPSIDGVYNGDISIDRFAAGEITVGKDLQVKQFSVQYTSRNGDKTISVNGSTIPSDISAELKNVGLNQTVFITNVIAVDSSGDLLRCYSMDLHVKFN